jgi:geranylgeranyl pyrophosphate synthase
MIHMDDIMKFLEEKKPMIDSRIEKYIPKKLDSKYAEWALGKARYEYDIETINKALAEPIWDFLERGGKRIRPALFLLVAEALGGDIEKLKDFVVIPELVHNGSIIIDDIEDQGEMRRGRPCLHKIFGADIAINAGSFMYFLPTLAFIKNKGNFDDKTLLKAYEVFLQEMINIHIGQAIDIQWHKGKEHEISEKKYMQMCAYKTGCLTRMAAKLAVVLSNGSEEQERALAKFAESIGIAFQIQDDILSASGKEFQKKKGFGDDITEGKRTLMVIYTLEKASPEDKKRLLEILDMHTRDENLIKEAIDIINKYKSIDYAKEVAKSLVKNAWEEVDSVLPKSGAKEKLKSFAEFLINREI